MGCSHTRFLAVFALVLAAASAAGALDLSGQAYLRYVDRGDVTCGPSSEFLVRRASVTAEANLADNISVELEVETRPNGAYLKDGLVTWLPWEQVELTLGLFKKPFCMATTTSNWRLLSVERPLAHGLASDLGFSGRSVGAMALFAPSMPLDPELSVGVFNGPGSDRERLYTALLEVAPFSDLSIGAGFASLRVGEPDPMQPSGYIVSDRLQAMSSHFRFRKWITGNNRLTVEGEFMRGDNWREADVIYGQEPPSFRTCWFSGLFERRLRDVPGIRSLEAGLSWSSMVPETDRDEESTVFAPMLGVLVTSNARLRLTLINRTFSDGTQGYSDYMAEVGVRF